MNGEINKSLLYFLSLKFNLEIGTFSATKGLKSCPEKVLKLHRLEMFSEQPFVNHIYVSRVLAHGKNAYVNIRKINERNKTTGSTFPSRFRYSIIFNKTGRGAGKRWVISFSHFHEFLFEKVS